MQRLAVFARLIGPLRDAHGTVERIGADVVSLSHTIAIGLHRRDVCRRWQRVADQRIDAALVGGVQRTPHCGIDIARGRAVM